MTIDPKELAKYDGKQVILTVADEESGDAKELEGKVEAASEAGLAFKEKGKRDVTLLMPSDVIEIALAPTKAKSLPQKKLKLVTESTSRQHLLDRHGYERSVVNAMTDEQAFAEHDDIDHSDLGHKHVDPDDDADNGDEGSESESSED